MGPFDEEDRPAGSGVHEIGQDLSGLSVDELHARIELLRAEIGRLEAESARKQASRAAADSIFKPSRGRSET